MTCTMVKIQVGHGTASSNKDCRLTCYQLYETGAGHTNSRLPSTSLSRMKAGEYSAIRWFASSHTSIAAIDLLWPQHSAHSSPPALSIWTTTQEEGLAPLPPILNSSMTAQFQHIHRKDGIVNRRSIYAKRDAEPFEVLYQRTGCHYLGAASMREATRSKDINCYSGGGRPAVNIQAFTSPRPPVAFYPTSPHITSTSAY
jgi:hypothetical protein